MGLHQRLGGAHKDRCAQIARWKIGGGKVNLAAPARACSAPYIPMVSILNLLEQGRYAELSREF